MKKNVYCIKDEKVGFLSPILDDNDQTAIRNFSFSISDPQNICNFAKSDFNLYFLGCFDTDTGMYTQDELPSLIASGGSLNV